MTKHPMIAFMEWTCPDCGGRLIEDSGERWDLRCETDGWTFEINGMSANYFHTEDDEPGCCEVNRRG